MSCSAPCGFRPGRDPLDLDNSRLYARREGVVATVALADFSPMQLASTVRLTRWARPR